MDEWSPLLRKGNRRLKKNMDVYINQAPEVEKSIFIIEIFGKALVWGRHINL